MRVITLDKNTQVENESSESYLNSLSESSTITHKSYHEMSDVPVMESDSLAQLHANLQLLGDLQARLHFVMKEVRYLLKA